MKKSEHRNVADCIMTLKKRETVLFAEKGKLYSVKRNKEWVLISLIFYT